MLSLYFVSGQSIEISTRKQIRVITNLNLCHMRNEGPALINSPVWCGGKNKKTHLENGSDHFQLSVF